MASADVQGKFLWHELVTADPGAAGAFYGKVLGWTPQAWDKDPSYTVLLSPKGPVGGIMRPGADAHGTSAHWINYVGTANVDETAASAQRLGGRVVKGASDIPGGGRYAVLADPQGAVFGVYTPSATGGAGPAADAFTWHELVTSDQAAALRFYRELFGWEQVAVHDMGAPVGPYVIFGRGGQQLGGIFARQGGGGTQWLAYARVSSASRAADAAKAGGGRVINGPMQVPGGSWIAQLADPHGAAIAVNQAATAESAQPAKPAAQPPKPVAKPAAPAAAARPSAPPSPTPAAASGSGRPAAPAPSPAPPKPAPAPAAPPPRPTAAPPAAAAKPAVVAPAKAAAPAKPAAPAKKAAAPAKKAAGKKAARKSAAKKKKKTARPARKAPAKKRSAKKASRGGARKRSAAKAKSARKAARGKRARKPK